jgi:flavin reductase (DIM6/NTAB) family NADH-FMN oxidoreductase RutF
MDKVKIGPSTFLFPMPAVLVGTEVEGRANFMTVAWCGIACHEPPAVAVAIRRQRYTMEGISTHGAFSVNVPRADMAKIVDYCGIHSGRHKDKSGIFGVTSGALPGVPLIDECPLCLECRVIHRLDLGSHALVVGEIIETYVSPECLMGKTIDPAKLDPLVYTPGVQVYQRLGEVVGKAFHDGRDITP